MNVLVTGAGGFIGRNLLVALAQQPDLTVLTFEKEDDRSILDDYLHQADFIFHLAGINRPPSEAEFWQGNAELTTYICDALLVAGRQTPLALSSSTQAELDNAYGRSKRYAEEEVARYAAAAGAPAQIYRLTNVFGKWSRPNYNSVVATFCYNIAHDKPITISDPDRVLELIHIDDVVAHFMQDLAEAATPATGADKRSTTSEARYRTVTPVHQVTLGGLADLLHSFRAMRQTLQIPDLSDPFTHKLYSIYLSYLETDDFAYDLMQRCDDRGCLAEFVKSATFGQIFVSRTVPGITRGNHYHHVKTEKFLVVEGEAIVRFRHIQDDDILEYPVSGTDFRVLDIPPGYTHSIENVGDGELITLFWASEIFDPERMDTYFVPV